MTKEKYSFIALILGIAALGLTYPFLFVWPFPQVVFFPFVLFFGISGVKSKRKHIAIIGIVLFLIALIFPIYFF